MSLALTSRLTAAMFGYDAEAYDIRTSGMNPRRTNLKCIRVTVCLI